MNTNNTTQYFENWGEAFTASMQNLWFKIAGFIPEIIGAIIVLIIGLLVAYFLGKIVEKILHYIKIDRLLEKTKVKEEIHQAWPNFTFSMLIGGLVRWFFYIVTFIAVVNVLKINQLTDFLNQIVFYIPNVLAAIIILTIGIILGNFIEDFVSGALRAAELSKLSSELLGRISKWAIIIFATLAALVQLKIAVSLIQIILGGFVTMMAIAGGLAFGLGGRDKAARWLDDFFKK